MRVWLFATFLGLLCASPCEGDVLRLTTGETILGRALPDESDESTLVVRDYTTGRLRRLRWETLAGDQRDAYARAWWRLDSHDLPVSGVRLTRRLADGTLQVLTGLLEEGGEASTVRLRSHGVSSRSSSRTSNPSRRPR